MLSGGDGTNPITPVKELGVGLVQLMHINWCFNGKWRKRSGG